MASLRWKDIDLEDGRISFTGKGEKPSIVGISSELADLLREWQSTLSVDWSAEWPVVCQSQKSGEDYLWDRPVRDYTVRNEVKKVGERIGIPSLRPHDMRRSLAGMLEAQGKPIDKISAMLRHENISTTQKYLESNPGKAVGEFHDFAI